MKNKMLREQFKEEILKAVKDCAESSAIMGKVAESKIGMFGFFLDECLSIPELQDAMSDKDINQVLVDALIETKEYFVSFDGLDVTKIARLMIIINSALNLVKKGD